MCIKRGCDSLCPDGVLPPKNAMYVWGSRSIPVPPQLTGRRSGFTPGPLDGLAPPAPRRKGSAYGTLQNRVTALEALLRANDIAIPAEFRSKGKEKEDLSSTASRTANRGGGGGGTSSDEDDGGRPGKADVKDEDDDDDWIPSFGTLELGKAGRARFVGATAGSLWLSNEVRASVCGSAWRLVDLSPVTHFGPPLAHAFGHTSERASDASSVWLVPILPAFVAQGQYAPGPGNVRPAARPPAAAGRGALPHQPLLHGVRLAVSV
jgi:hypothetical protein